MNEEEYYPNSTTPLITEAHLFLALEVLAYGGDEELEDTATKDVIIYIVNQNPDGILDSHLKEEFNKLIVNHTLNKLAKNGLVKSELDEDGNETFEITDLGRKAIQ